MPLMTMRPDRWLRLFAEKAHPEIATLFCGEEIRCSRRRPEGVLWSRDVFPGDLTIVTIW